MREVRAALYKSKWGDGHILDNTISLWTWPFNIGTPPLSHEEKWVPDEEGNFIIDGKPVGRCFTSTKRDEVNGCRFKDAAAVFKHPERWLIIKYWLYEDNYDAMLEECDRLIAKNKGYNTHGLFGFAWPWRWPLWLFRGEIGKWYCSQVCAWLNYIVAFWQKWYIRISPRRSWRTYTRKGYKSQELKDILCTS